MRILLPTLLFALLAHPGESFGRLQAQAVNPERVDLRFSPVHLAANLRTEVARTGGPMFGVLPALVQLRSSHPAAELNALADSMVVIAAHYHAGGGPEAIPVVRAVSGILRSAMAWRGPPGTAYEGAGARVVDLALALDGRGGTTQLLTEIPDRLEGLEHVRRFAISPSLSAAAAIDVLAASGGEEGLVILRDLHDQGLVTQSLARILLEGAARAQGWR